MNNLLKEKLSSNKQIKALSIEPLKSGEEHKKTNNSKSQQNFHDQLKLRQSSKDLNKLLPNPQIYSFRHAHRKVLYGVNSTRGLIRNYNEDRVTIIVNVKQNREYKKKWPPIHYFAVYDGHGGSGCVDFLKNHLHKYIF